MVTNSRRMTWAGHAARTEKMRNAYKSLIGKREGKRPRGICRYRREDNIRMNLMEIGWEGVDWMNLAQDRKHLGTW
jgi:hypothetical protein